MNVRTTAVAAARPFFPLVALGRVAALRSTVLLARPSRTFASSSRSHSPTASPILRRQVLTDSKPTPIRHGDGKDDADAGDGAGDEGESSPSQEMGRMIEIDRLMTSVRARHPSPSHALPFRMRPLERRWADDHARVKGKPLLPFPVSPYSYVTPEERDEVEKDPTKKPTGTPMELDERPRYMHESYISFELPFSSNPELLERYIAYSGHIRVGRLLEDLDTLSGSIAYKHVLGDVADLHGAADDIYIVTASVDRMDVLKPFSKAFVEDLRLSGQVIYTGNSSMEIFVRIETIDPEEEYAPSPTASNGGSTEASKAAVPYTAARDSSQAGTRASHQPSSNTVLLARFTMACRDKRTGKARKVPPLIVDSEEAKALQKMGEDHKNRKRMASAKSLDRVPPSREEAAMLHSMMMSVKDKKTKNPERKDILLMEDTKLESVRLMHPQERNVHEKIFGGFLMRVAFELAHCNAALFLNAMPTFMALDEISFRKPVNIGSVLELTSHIVHTPPVTCSSSPTSPTENCAEFQVSVQAHVVDMLTGEKELTNRFEFTFAAPDGVPLRKQVEPRTYEESMRWLEGKRRWEVGSEVRRLYVAHA